MKIRLVPIFRSIREGEAYLPVIVSYGVSDWVMKDNKVIGWHHMLYINLYLIELRFSWYTGEKI